MPIRPLKIKKLEELHSIRTLSFHNGYFHGKSLSIKSLNLSFVLGTEECHKTIKVSTLLTVTAGMTAVIITTVITAYYRNNYRRRHYFRVIITVITYAIITVIKEAKNQVRMTDFINETMISLLRDG